MPDNSKPPQKSKRTIRIAWLVGVFIVAMFIAPKVLTALAGPSRNYSGSLAVLFLLPEVAAALWVFFTVATVAIFIRQGSSFGSMAGCVGIAFALAIIGTIVTFWIYDIPPYGPGP